MGLLQEARRLWGHGRSDQEGQDPATAIVKLKTEFNGIEPVDLERYVASRGRQTFEGSKPSYELGPDSVVLHNTLAHKRPGQPFAVSLVSKYRDIEQLVTLSCPRDEVEPTHPMTLISSLKLDGQDGYSRTIYISSGRNREVQRWVFKV